MSRRVVLIVLATIALNTLIAAALSVVGSPRAFWPTFVQSQAIGSTIAAACWAVAPWVERAQGAARVGIPLFGAALALGVLVGMQLAALLTGWMFGTDGAALASPDGLMSMRTAVLSLGLGVFGTVVFYGRERLEHARTRAESESWRALAAERSAAQASLQALRAQVEPHFLFNTLANVSALIERDPAAARALVDDLARHLRSTLQHARAATSTLGEELDVIESLLAIMKRRLGERISWRIDVPESLRAQQMPPMLVQPLVENAVKHGIEPAVAGSSIAVGARHDADGTLVLEVADTGLGLAQPDGPATSGSATGTGLSNLAQRLRAIYGPGARVTLHENRPRGTIARLVVPVAAPAEASASTRDPASSPPRARTAAACAGADARDRLR